MPHGALHYIPFNALQDGKQYLIERYSIRVLPSASVLKYLKAGKANKPGVVYVVFGDPDLGDPSYDLANAQNELWPWQKCVLSRRCFSARKPR